LPPSVLASLANVKGSFRIIAIAIISTLTIISISADVFSDPGKIKPLVVTRIYWWPTFLNERGIRPLRRLEVPRRPRLALVKMRGSFGGQAENHLDPRVPSIIAPGNPDRDVEIEQELPALLGVEVVEGI
jgi:hypothetical protein